MSAPCHTMVYYIEKSIVQYTLENLTPHSIVIEDKSGTLITILPTPNFCPRIEIKTTLIKHIGNIPIFTTTYGKIVDLPYESTSSQGVHLNSYIVSRLVKNACPNRKDFLCPVGLLRDDKGNVTGCTGLTLN